MGSHMIKYYTAITSNILENISHIEREEWDNDKYFIFYYCFFMLSVTGNFNVSFLHLCIMMSRIDHLSPQIPIKINQLH